MASDCISYKMGLITVQKYITYMQDHVYNGCLTPLHRQQRSHLKWDNDLFQRDLIAMPINNCNLSQCFSLQPLACTLTALLYASASTL